MLIKTSSADKIVINSGNGAAGVDALSDELRKLGVKTNFVYVHHEPDHHFQMVSPTLFLKKKG